MRFFLNYFLSSMPEAESGFFEESILYSHFRIILNISTVFVSLFYYNSTIMEQVNNFNYVPRYLSDRYFFSKTYFKRDAKFNLDLPKNSSFHFLTSKVAYLSKRDSFSSRNSPLKFKRLVKSKFRSFIKTSNIIRNSKERLIQYLTKSSFPSMTLRT
jgi:hypothetical protein